MTTSDRTVRLYGRVMGHSSHAQVTRGFEAALRAAGKLSGVMGLDVLGLDEQIGVAWAKEGSGNAECHHGAYTGHLEALYYMLRSKHERRWVMVAPNSNFMPERIIKLINEVATDVMAPSSWAAEMLAPLVTAPISVVPHGVHAGFERSAFQRGRVAEDYKSGQFRVLHCSTSERQRKGTWELLQAWERLVEDKELPEQAELILVLDYAAQLRFAERMLDEGLNPPRVQVLHRLDASPVQMADIFRRVHVVCQPSRAEAFGLVPLESLACGTPVVMTSCTGHAQYLDSLAKVYDHPMGAGVEIIVTGTAVEIDDGPEAMCPALEAESVRIALRSAYEQWSSLSERAFEVAPWVVENWSWHRQLADWMEKL